MVTGLPGFKITQQNKCLPPRFVKAIRKEYVTPVQGNRDQMIWN